jgi:GTP-binding protein Era
VNQTELNQRKCSFIALIGQPNAGKSTLLNQLVGSKVSIVTPKVQTTRDVINGICIHQESQLIFIDTPGIFKPRQGLEKILVKRAWSGALSADYTALLIDSKKGVCENTQQIIESLIQKKIKCDVILNKIDLVRKNSLLELIKQLSDYEIVSNIFMVSARTGEGVESLKEYYSKKAHPGPWMYDEDEITSAPMKFLATEIVREQLMWNLSEELPYGIAVKIEKWEEVKKQVKLPKHKAAEENNNTAAQSEITSLKIYMVIYTNKASHKKIIIGEKGSMLKKIGERARKELSKLFDQHVHLFLYVKVKENWIQDREIIENS